MLDAVPWTTTVSPSSTGCLTERLGMVTGASVPTVTTSPGRIWGVKPAQQPTGRPRPAISVELTVKIVLPGSVESTNVPVDRSAPLRSTVTVPGLNSSPRTSEVLAPIATNGMAGAGAGACAPAGAAR